MSVLQPSYGIHNDPLPVALCSGPAGDRQRSFQPMMTVPMAQVEHKPEAVLGSPPVEVHNRVNYNRNHNKVNNNKAPELLHLLLPPKAPTNPNSHLPNDRLPHDCFRHSHLLHDCLPHSRLLRYWTMGL